MKFLVDANVLSEAMRAAPDPSVIQWLERNESQLTVDPVILGELRFGILLLAKGARRKRLEKWFESGVRRLRCLPWDAATGLRWAVLLADLRKAGHSMPVKDSMIAATALTYSLTIVTRNTADFKNADAGLINPFS